jgi:hypothetical protein
LSEEKPKEGEKKPEIPMKPVDDTKKGVSELDKIESKGDSITERSIGKQSSQDARRDPPLKYYSSKHYESKYPDSRDSSRPPHSYKRDYYPPSSSSGYRDERD